MAVPTELIQGEFHRSLDERYRLVIPSELIEQLGATDNQLILAKERPGCLSLWNAQLWQGKLAEGMDLVHRKIQAGKLDGRLGQVQMLGRLLSTRHKSVALAARGRLLLPEGFREFLRVEPGGDVMIVGAAVCVEVWNLRHWLEYLETRLPKFRKLFDSLSS